MWWNISVCLPDYMALLPGDYKLDNSISSDLSFFFFYNVNKMKCVIYFCMYLCILISCVHTCVHAHLLVCMCVLVHMLVTFGKPWTLCSNREQWMLPAPTRTCWMFVFTVHARSQYISNCTGVPGPNNNSRTTSLASSHDSWTFLCPEQASSKERVLH